MSLKNKVYIVKPNETVSHCRICGHEATHIRPNGTYLTEYKINEDDSYDHNTHTYICYFCMLKKIKGK